MYCTVYNIIIYDCTCFTNDSRFPPTLFLRPKRPSTLYTRLHKMHYYISAAFNWNLCLINNTLTPVHIYAYRRRIHIVKPETPGGGGTMPTIWLWLKTVRHPVIRYQRAVVGLSVREMRRTHAGGPRLYYIIVSHASMRYTQYNVCVCVCM